MAITTLDGVVAGAQPPVFWSKALSGTLVAGRPWTSLFAAGYPGAASAPSPGIGGASVTSFGGQIPYSNPASGNKYLSRFSGQCGTGGMMLLCDMLWWNSGITITSNTEQTFTGSAQIPSRDVNGSNLGEGVYPAVFVSGATGAGTPTLTFKYTNQAGSTNKTGTNLQATAASTAVGTFHQIGLAAGDTGVRQATSLTLSATWSSGTIHACLYRVIASLDLTTTGYPNSIDAISGGLPRLYDNTCPFLVFVPAATTSSFTAGTVVYTEG